MIKDKKYIIIKTFLLAAIVGVGVYLADPALLARAADNSFLLTWSSDSYVPPDYEGKALPSRGSLIKVAAIPVKKLTADPDQLYYRWLLDNEIVYPAQGQGKSSFQFPATKWSGDSHEIESQILDEQGNLLWRGFLAVKITSPQLLLKKQNGGYAVQEALSAATGQSLTLIAVPFFFHAQKPADLSFTWTIDQQKPEAGDEKTPDQLIIKIPAGSLSSPVSKALSLFVQNKTDQLQRSTINLSIEIK